MLTLSFISLFSLWLKEVFLTYGIHHCLQGILGYLILFITQAFVPQRQFKYRISPLPLPVLEVLKNFISSPLILNYFLL
jgi:hypothetical protein